MFWASSSGSKATIQTIDRDLELIGCVLGDGSVRADPDNPASGNVLRKLGFRFTGETQKRHSLGRNAIVDCLIFEEGEGGGMNDDPMMDAYANDLPVAA